MAVTPGAYSYFKGTVPERKIHVGVRQQNRWRYYDYGPKSVPPLVCIAGAAGTADVFYKQILTLSSKGYRLIAVDSPALWNHQEWIASFDKFLDTLHIYEVHLYGTSLGGFLAQLFCQHRPRRVKSLILSNAFLDTGYFHEAFTWSSLFQWAPEFVLKRLVLLGLREGPHELQIADSIDFVVGQLETLTQKELASRLTLNTNLAVVGPLQLEDSRITIMDTNDYCAVPQQLREAVLLRYPNARRALLKSGGDFPFLSRADEVNLHLQLHLRRVGVKPEAPSPPPTPPPGPRWPPREPFREPEHETGTSNTETPTPNHSPPVSSNFAQLEVPTAHPLNVPAPPQAASHEEEALMSPMISPLHIPSPSPVKASSSNPNLAAAVSNQPYLRSISLPASPSRQSQPARPTSPLQSSRLNDPLLSASELHVAGEQILTQEDKAVSGELPLSHSPRSIPADLSSSELEPEQPDSSQGDPLGAL